MESPTHDLIRRFFANLGAGTPDPDMFTDDMIAWTISTHADAPGQSYLGATRMLAALFAGTLRYDVKALIVEGDRAAAQVRGSGTLASGERYENDYAHLFDLRDGRIARIAEFFDPAPVNEKIMPLLLEAMAAK
ncbi:nuclear transport factor 2 family protein [Novosphingobium album (ex Liu et al. 2023)]|uniref:Nuclear transport factor 2 family protein n=1 Tax=Novosphingobium album (ex Liu et al. 2023) TaxID=3031130 RepID=A0ABT5WLX6_9SPHN|nr:nuclear transport factor 2 family protein [Novosphingobium album (ex Liu et al. 2023)]MDE8651040.1 nuclear transport factor 2 family protein [Novosphingobium album (ex Liu et al. 2023)]